MLARIVRHACRNEVLARKPGNVHPGASFDDLTVDDFLRSADAIAPVMARAANCPVGQTILDAVQATTQVARSNTNLGIILLFAPICRAIATGGTGQADVARVLDNLTQEDARLVYQAIREAIPGGLGKVSQQDVTEEPTVTLREAMQLAADRDSIARQYVTGMADIWQMRKEILRPARESGMAEEECIVWCHLVWMARFPDTLIARKCGWEIARESADRADQILRLYQQPSTNKAESRPSPPVVPLPKPGWMKSAELAEFDRWLRSDGHRRNPGTSADLLAATLLVDSWMS
jgi:triphosphoribosyl-dephospho-CoA synthase